ncbi:MAG: FCD domain-containing protein [Promicromonosporaceae bacterium]|nr:FCD domain-containing protein [Promicromonosporaceae bacterium]
MRAHQQVLAQIEAKMLDGTWGLGERLPGERALAEQMGVSRPSVREAISVLEALGIVKMNVGSGPGAGTQIVDRPAVGLGMAVRMHIAAGTLPVADVVATRAQLESGAVRHAAALVADLSPAEGEDLGAVRAALRAMEAPGPLAVDEFLRLDESFHMGIVRLSGNQLTEAILTGLRSAIAMYIAQGAAQVPDWGETCSRLCREHRQIYEAVLAGDGSAAESLSHAHIWAFYAEAGLAGEREHP